MDELQARAKLIARAAEVVSAYVSRNHVPAAELTRLIGEVHQALAHVALPLSAAPEAQPQRASSAAIKRSLTPEHLISFENGKRYKTLRRHLAVLGLTPVTYRAKWGLPPDYPMVAPSYTQQRSRLAKALGLGQQRRGRVGLSATNALKVEAAESAVGEGGGGEASLASNPEPKGSGPAPKRRGREKVPPAA